MPQNQIYPIATAPGANVLDSGAWQTSLARLNGFSAGTAPSNAFNKAWRGSSVIASALAQFVVDTTGLDVLDDGDVSGFNAKLKAALATILVTSVPPLYSGAANSNSTSSAIAANLSPSMTGYTAEGLYIVKMLYPCLGATTAAFNGLPATPIVKYNGLALSGLEWQAGDLVAFSYNGNTFTLLNDNTLETAINLNVSTVAGLLSAYAAAGRMVLSSAASITINVAAGLYQFTSITGPLLGKHPFGDRISIVGPTLKAPWPTSGQIRSAGGNAATLSLWRSVLSAEFQGVGTDIIRINAGALGSLQNILLSGDGTNSGGHYGILCSNWSTSSPGRGDTQLINVAAHNFGIDGIRAEQLGFIQCNNAAATYCTRASFWVSHGSIIEVNIGNILGMYSKYGLCPQNTGACYVDSASGTVDFSFSQSHNVYAASMGKFDCSPCTGVRITNAGTGGQGGWGVFNVGLGQINLGAYVTFGSNASGDITADIGAVTTAVGASVGTCSPTANGGINSRGAAIYV